MSRRSARSWLSSACSTRRTRSPTATRLSPTSCRQWIDVSPSLPRSRPLRYTSEMRRLILDAWFRWFGEPLRKVEAESLAYRLSDAGRGMDWKTIAVILTAAVCLTIQNYASHPDRLIPLSGFVASLTAGPEARRQVEATLLAWGRDQSTALAWFGICAILTYTVLPVILIKFCF